MSPSVFYVFEVSTVLVVMTGMVRGSIEAGLDTI